MNETEKRSITAHQNGLSMHFWNGGKRRYLRLQRISCFLVAIAALPILKYNDLLVGDGDDPQDAARKPIETHPQSNTASPLHLCTTQRPQFPSQSGNSSNLVINYLCAGEAYDSFGEKLNHFAHSKSTEIPSWGLRAFPFPANASVLFMGNSHMAQVVHTLLCQYASVVQHFTIVDNGYYGWYSTTVFTNGARLDHASNSPLVYSLNWPDHVRDLLFGRALSEYSLVVLGRFHHYKPAILNTGFGRAMVKHTLNSTNDFDFYNVRPPDLADMRQVYAGPLIAVSTFAAYDKSASFNEQCSTVNTSSSSSFLHSSNSTMHAPCLVVNGRQYIPPLGECGSPTTRHQVADCDNSQPNNYRHRCTGQHGGHADLISWDVMEAVYKSLEYNKM